MKGNYKNDFRLIDPREEEIEQTTANLYEPALKECGFKLPLYVLIYNQVRYYEDFGKLKIGYSIQSKEAFAEQFGVSVKQVEKAFDNLTNVYKLGNWVICDTKIFRNVTKVWVSNVRQKRGTMDEAIRLLQSMSKQNELLPNRSKSPELLPNRSKTPITKEQNSYRIGIATPEPTGAESNNKIIERGGDTPTPPFDKVKQIQQEDTHFVSGGKSKQNDAQTVNGNPFEKQSIYDSIGTTEKILRESERKRQQAELSEICLAVAAEFGDTRLARNKKLRPRIAALLSVGYTRWDITRVAHNWHDLKDKQGQLFGFGIFSDAMFPTLLKQEPKPEIWTR